MLQNVRQRTLRLPERELEISLLDWGGSGPLALLSHANGFCTACWDLVAQQLRSRYRVIGFDARGHGDSQARQQSGAYDWGEFVKDLIAVTEILVAEHGPAYGIGHSFGGTVTMTAASQRPELFDRLAMADPVLIPPDIAITPERIERSDSMREMALKRRNVWPSRSEVLASWSTRPPFDSWDPRALELYTTYGLRDRDDGQVELKCAGAVEAAVYENNGSLNIYEVAEKLATPTLLLFAARGNFTREVCAEVQQRAADLRVVDIEAGHLLPMEAPDAVARELLAFGPASS